jgi:replicative DNA helicase
MVDLTLQMSKQGTPAFLYSGETSRVPLRQRFLSRESEIDLERLRGEHPVQLGQRELTKIHAAGKTLAALPIYTDFSTLSPSGILTQMERTLLGNEIPLDQSKVILYDYLQFASGGESQDRVFQIGTLVREFKYLCKLLECPVVLFSQLRRSREKDPDDRPTMADYADSATIERTADTCMLLYGERAEGPFAGRWIDFPKQREGRANVRLHYLLHQGYGRWECTDNRPVPTADFSLMEES